MQQRKRRKRETGYVWTIKLLIFFDLFLPCQVFLLCLAMYLSRVPFRGSCCCFVLFCFLFYFRKAFRTHMGMITSAVPGTCLQDGHTFSQVWCVHQGYLWIKKSSSQVEAAKSLLGKVHACNADSSLMARPEELGPTRQGPLRIFVQNLLAFQETMLGSLLPHLCVLGFAIGSLSFHSICDTHFLRTRERKIRLWLILVCLWGPWKFC